MSLGRTLIFIPTYNERDNAEKMAREVTGLGLDADVLFTDDASPDGTGELLDRLAKELPRLRVRHRAGKLGIGSAHKDAITFAYEQGYSTLITMDCDFTHPPSYIPDFIAMAAEADVVVGSRYMRRDSLDEWNAYRLVLTRVGHALTRLFLGMPFDATGAFRLYRLDRISAKLFARVESDGYSFFFESLYLLFRDGRKIKETPITLPARTYGTSKMRLSDAVASVARLARLWRLAGRLDQAAPEAPSTEEWDEYWQRRDKAGEGKLYDRIASVYRVWVIKRNLERAIFGHFKPGSALLHAGCGSGDADTDITRAMRVTALDLSRAALELYKRNNGERAQVICGSAFEVPLPDAGLDGVYNLGVIEHFAEPDIVRMLREFRRILKPGGKAVLFWPKRFGLSTIALDAAHAVRRLFGITRKLHPDELTRVRSKSHAERLLREAGLSLVEYSFGPRDFFVQAVVVGQKEGA